MSFFTLSAYFLLFNLQIYILIYSIRFQIVWHCGLNHYYIDMCKAATYSKLLFQTFFSQKNTNANVRLKISTNYIRLPSQCIFPNFWRRAQYSRGLTVDRRQRSESIWFRANESPIKAIFLPRRVLRNVSGLKRRSSHLSGFHLQWRKSLSFLPCKKQFLKNGIVVQL